MIYLEAIIENVILNIFQCFNYFYVAKPTIHLLIKKLLFQNSAECFCKPNVYGQACDLCKEGTFNIQENNADGCTKCFCSGKTSRCSSSNLYRTQVIICMPFLIGFQ